MYRRLLVCLILLYQISRRYCHVRYRALSESGAECMAGANKLTLLHQIPLCQLTFGQQLDPTRKQLDPIRKESSVLASIDFSVAPAAALYAVLET